MGNGDSLERALPNSAEAERAILGGIILDNGLINQAIELLRPEDFYVPSHRRIFVAMIAIFERGGEIGPILIGEELKKENALESVGGVTFIANLTWGLPHSRDLSHYAKVIKDAASLRQMIKAANKITQEALEYEEEADVILDNAERLILSVRAHTMKTGFSRIDQIADVLLEKAQEGEGHGGTLTGLSTGYVELDQLTLGLQKQDLIILAARPSMGKTSFALMLARNAALGKDGVVGIFSLEMAKEAIVARMLCADAMVDSFRFRKGFLAKNEWGRLAATLGLFHSSKIFIDDTAGISSLELRAKSRRLATEQKRIDLIVVDYLQLMSGTAKRQESRQQEVSQISRDLKSLAKELDVPVVALSQLSRAPESRADHRPQLSDLRESGALEQDADMVAFIYNETVNAKSQAARDAIPEDRRNVAEIIVAKQRNGPTDTVDLRFTPSCLRFDNLYRE